MFKKVEKVLKKIKQKTGFFKRDIAINLGMPESYFCKSQFERFNDEKKELILNSLEEFFEGCDNIVIKNFQDEVKATLGRIKKKYEKKLCTEDLKIEGELE